jgi:short-subunit dehydrogenase
MKLENKIAVITGAGRGIGESIAHAFADEGADLILTARTRQQLDRVADAIQAKNRQAAVMPCDVSSPA